MITFMAGCASRTSRSRYPCLQEHACILRQADPVEASTTVQAASTYKQHSEFTVKEACYHSEARSAAKPVHYVVHAFILYLPGRLEASNWSVMPHFQKSVQAYTRHAP